MVFTCFAINDSGCLKAATVPCAIPLCYWDLVLDSWSLHFFRTMGMFPAYAGVWSSPTSLYFEKCTDIISCHCLRSLNDYNWDQFYTSFCRTFMMDWIFHSIRMFNIHLEYSLWNSPLMAGNLLLAAMMNQYMSMTCMQTNWHCVYLLIQYDKLLTFLAYISLPFFTWSRLCFLRGPFFSSYPTLGRLGLIHNSNVHNLVALLSRCSKKLLWCL